MLDHLFDIWDENDSDKILYLGEALSSKTRLDILRQLGEGWKSIMELAELNFISVSSVIFHINILKKADLINVIYVDGSKRKKAYISRSVATINLKFYSESNVSSDTFKYFESCPIGGYINAEFGSKSGIISNKYSKNLYTNSPFISERFSAQLIYTNYGFVEYAFDNSKIKNKKIIEISFSLEICSETSYFNNEFKSDITFSINGIEILLFTSLGDFGGRRGKYTPTYWSEELTQFGQLKTIIVNENGVFLDGIFVSNKIKINDLMLEKSNLIKFKVESKKDAINCGGFNIFGEQFGDFNQNINMTIIYKE